MEEVPIPSVPIPEGYEIHESEYVIKGLCPKCSKKYGK
jgi:Fur family ferric uptake transcriptional regulator